MPNEINGSEFVASLVVLAEHGIPTDVQELLVRGDPMRGIKPNALYDALAAAVPASPSDAERHERAVPVAYVPQSVIDSLCRGFSGLYEMSNKPAPGHRPDCTVPLYAAPPPPAAAQEPVAENERLRAALRPFADRAGRYDEIPGIIRIGDDVELWQLEDNKGMRVDVTVADLRRARAAVAPEQEEAK
ncbi:hypothetical protein [Rhizobium rhizogenes]|uniref:hypothetical protein n=1 Tax=Rhizobium rhizogenes TaxID=359 RepID=UPI0015720E66|nr:hypothetical protein [Rhizobium rhizogenes]NTG94214.1 hypothetical protein [Rhizobium rhizogenes]